MFQLISDSLPFLSLQELTEIERQVSFIRRNFVLKQSGFDECPLRKHIIVGTNFERTALVFYSPDFEYFDFQNLHNFASRFGTVLRIGQIRNKFYIFYEHAYDFLHALDNMKNEKYYGRDIIPEVRQGNSSGACDPDRVLIVNGVNFTDFISKHFVKYGTITEVVEECDRIVIVYGNVASAANAMCSNGIELQFGERTYKLEMRRMYSDADFLR